MTPLKNYLLAFEALARHKTVGDAADLMESFGFDTDRLIVCGHPGLGNLKRLADNMEWNPEKCHKILVKFKGGPGADKCGKSIFTASLVCFVVDRLLKAIDIYGEEFVLKEIESVWGIKAR